MKVKLLGPFRDLANTYDVEIDCVNIEDLIQKLIQKYGRSFEQTLMKYGNIIVLNGRIMKMNELQTTLNEGDQVTFLTISVGG